MRVPFNCPAMVGREIDYMLEAMRALHLSGDGSFAHRCQALLEQELGAFRVLLTTSCSDALEMAALLLGTGPGDEVILPSFTFVSTANAFVLRGTTPRFADIRSDTLNLDENGIERLITERTRAIVVMHYAGVGCEMDAILKIAARHGLAVVEDNAHGLFGRYRGKPLGTWGSLATQSFHETKNFTCGEGGALVLNDPKYAERADILRDKGTNRKQFFEGQVDKYTWVDVGSSFLPSDLLAAFLYAQLEHRHAIQEHRKGIWKHYLDRLTAWARNEGIRLPFVPPHCEHTAHIFYLLLPNGECRRRLMSYMAERGISVVFHYQPLHLSGMGLRLGGAPGQNPVSERVGECLLRLPLFYRMTEEQMEKVVSALLDFHVEQRELMEAQA